jgi:hypothetical protein
MSYFVTTDYRTILHHRRDLESQFGIRAVWPSQFTAAL